MPETSDDPIFLIPRHEAIIPFGIQDKINRLGDIDQT
jgi:hypothetical protein